VPAALGLDLILEDDAGRAGKFELGNAALHNVKVAVPGVGVCQHRDRDPLGHAPRGLHHLF